MGLILTPPLCDDPEVIKLLEAQHCNYVLIAPNNPDSAHFSVNMDDVAAAREITEYLLGLGHRRIGYIRGHPNHGASVKRYQGYCEALAKYGLEPNEDLIRQGHFDYSTGLEAAELLLDMQKPPTAIFASNDDMAAAAISAAYSRHIEVPKQLSIIGFDHTRIAGIISPQLTTVRQPISELAASAVRILSNNISRRFSSEDDENAIFLDYDVVKRNSTGPPPQGEII